MHISSKIFIMTKRIIGIFLLVALNVTVAYTQHYKALRILPKTFFRDGEEFVYQLRYGFIVGGKVTLQLSEKGNLFHARGEAITVGVADKLYRVKDVYESYFEKESNMPILAIQNVREGRSYTYYSEVIFDRKNNKVTSSKAGQQEVPSDIVDMMSLFYYIRRIDMSNINPGDMIKINTFFFDKLFPFEIKYVGKEIIETKFGKIRCLKFAPIVEPGRVFKSKDAMLIWFTDDSNRIPVLVSLGMVVGHVYCEIIEIKNALVEPVFIPKEN